MTDDEYLRERAGFWQDTSCERLARQEAPPLMRSIGCAKLRTSTVKG